ncbi:hypothetical protein OIN60_10020 [Paenibacillus sp. P96]|uniref:Acetolactate synthase small subunit C-terminal domain-containing protein n=1 Tax=Paenibacillus zeirhizosphaerae TaxID=2987519 RepID=A0ABT9FQW1_9BACL|nr:hypothetical protein [Paenibacillus sp. P96]MDP4097105.1 hypothetical protein [Paenibacillus sp. P96]
MLTPYCLNEHNNALLHLLKPYGLLELTRTGETAMSRP